MSIGVVGGGRAEAGAAPRPGALRALAPGVEYGVLDGASVPGGAGRFHVVRVDPAKARLVAVTASSGIAGDKAAHTAGAFCDRMKLLAAINLGMFLDDGKSNVGYARIGAHLNHSRWVKKYQSVLVMGPKKPGQPQAALLDLDAPGVREGLGDWEVVIQNLRLIKTPGHNAWGPQPRRWSEAAVAMDKSGRILFVHCRHALSMTEFNRVLLALPLDVTAAMHVEGGPEASLSVRGPERIDLNGSFETGFNENDLVNVQWPIPNVLGVTAKP